MLRWTPHCFFFCFFLTANILPKHAVLVNLSTCHLYSFLMGFPWKFGWQMHPRLSRPICAHRPNKLLVKPNHLSLLKRPQGCVRNHFSFGKILSLFQNWKKECRGWCKPKWISMVSPDKSELWGSYVAQLTKRQNHKHSSKKKKKKRSLKVFLQHIKYNFCTV